MILTVSKEEKFLKIKWNQIQQEYWSDSDVLFEIYYEDIQNQYLKAIFTTFHYRLNGLFRLLNEKNRNEQGGYYNASPSREILAIWEYIQTLQVNLRNTTYHFILDEHYECTLKACKNFLNQTNGSQIPTGFQKINIIESKPIFTMSDTITLKKEEKIQVPTKLIGSGSYAHVYKYTDPYYNRVYAIKKARKDLTKIELARFKNEFIELSKLHSPYIIEVYSYDDDKHQYIMEYADITLEKFMSKYNNQLSMVQRINLVMQIFKAFTYIHGKRLLHRDISYQNILLKQYEDGSNIIKISDFGLVKLEDSQLTRKGTEIKGVLNDPDLDKVGFENYEIRHEIYALSWVVHFVLTGKKNSVFYKNKQVEEFIIRGLDADITKRHSSVQEMTEAFRSIRSFLIREGN